MSPVAFREHARSSAVLAATPAGQAELGALPEWDLAQLYPGMDSEAFRTDLAWAEGECRTFAEAYRGRLDDLARSGGRAELGVPHVALMALDLPTYQPDRLPPELQAIPPVKPGSRPGQGPGQAKA